MREISTKNYKLYYAIQKLFGKKENDALQNTKDRICDDIQHLIDQKTQNIAKNICEGC